MTQTKAQIIVDALNEDPEDEWTYKVVEILCPDDIIRVTVQAFNADDEYLGTF